MHIVEPVPKREVREFYFTYLKLPRLASGPKHTSHRLDEAVVQVVEMYHRVNTAPAGLVIVHDDCAVEIVDVGTGDHIRLILGGANAENEPDARSKSLIQAVLRDSKIIANSFAKIVACMERGEYRITMLRRPRPLN
jgi:hypothetical protein